MNRALVCALWAFGCAHVTQTPDVEVRRVAMAFVEASERGDFEAAYALLSSRWRAVYTPKTLARDFGAEGLSKARLERARAALLSGISGELSFDVGGGRAYTLVREGSGVFVDSLE